MSESGLRNRPTTDDRPASLGRMRATHRATPHPNQAESGRTIGVEMIRALAEWLRGQVPGLPDALFGALVLEYARRLIQRRRSRPARSLSVSVVDQIRTHEAVLLELSPARAFSNASLELSTGPGA